MLLNKITKNQKPIQSLSHPSGCPNIGVHRHLKILTEFYPKHIEKEDTVFFPSSRAYFCEQEDQAMLSEFWEFDRNMIHEKYKSVVEGIERHQ